ncbi:MAG TPA: HEAT repeat domain-containing protein [Pyrinomonadaceae bacterium]|jgi:HEAT repeat protein|nr:HEAT repeat domain-containing protein [Pyrinomonadaceae bacterium]
MRRYQRRFPLAAIPTSIFLLGVVFQSVICGSTLQNPTLTPMQIAIEEQRQRLNSGEVEDRREALMRLRALQRPEASRVALSALNDPAPIVRATAAAAVLWLPSTESAASLVPLLNDKDEFVRQQAAYALGQTQSHNGIAPLIERLTDKKDSVRGAAAFALGQIGDATAVTSLAALLNPQAGLTPTNKGQNTKREKNLFVLRAAAHSLGQIGNRAAVPALILALQDGLATGDLRREAASALGAIGDASAIPALRVAETAGDPYLAETAHQALRKISRSQTTGGI